MSNDTISKIRFSRPLVSVQDIVRYIDKGEEYSKLDVFETNTQSDPTEFLGAIILNPTYQREYRSTQKEESLIIESILLNIPIPEVFLVRIPKNENQVRNVMDGRHRLNAIYRFIKGKYKLQGLEVIEREGGNSVGYNGKYFFDLDSADKINILTYKISILEFDALHDDELERELFTRYNKATKPLEPQEIRYATYASKTSMFVSSFINKLKENKSDPLYKIYNFTKTRSETQRIHQNIFVILNIIEKGLNTKLSKSTEVAEEYMKTKNVEFKNNTESDSIQKKFEMFNNFIIKISQKKEYPFSSRLLADKTGPGSYLFQAGIAMVLSALFYYCEIDADNNYEFIEDISKCINAMISEDNKAYGGCSTNSRIIAESLLKLDFTQYPHIIPQKLTELSVPH